MFLFGVIMLLTRMKGGQKMRRNLKQLRAIAYSYTKKKHEKAEQIMDASKWRKEYSESQYKNVVNFLRIKKNIED